MDNIEIVHKLFPIFDINHVNFCIKAIEIKYRLKKIKKIKMNISNTVSISDTRLSKIYYDNLDNADEILSHKYLTIQKTFSLIYEKYNSLEENNTIDAIVSTKSLIREKINIKFLR